ncbi:hypothetical protein CBR_g2839 [Chara braunii]|uniref:Uncharacterized protein n=1 Tax=Chara braunii TaxID=69332 RepID=A0A388KEB7_CHABU|nr:hypothetical protein CBR_g2839 [Chara braunii]|eukprot:GBG68293.1 hypothetical protein CBR_g2839 [Chara braunii]
MVIGILFPQLVLENIMLRHVSLGNLTMDGFGSSDCHDGARQSNGTQGADPENNTLANIDLPVEARSLPPGIVEKRTDLYMRKLWGDPAKDLVTRPKYLLAMAVGIHQFDNVNKMVSKFPKETTTIILWHYDGVVSEWHAMDWAKTAIHIAAKKQTKWWFAKRFLHPDVVEPYDYLFIWDEDLGVEAFDLEEYIRIKRIYGFEISQPGLFPGLGAQWEMTKRQVGREAHTFVMEQPGYCASVHAPPCSGFVEIMAPVFSRAAWRCVWYLIQGPAYQKVGVVDSVWVTHLGIPSLGNQGESSNGSEAWVGVRERCVHEWDIFKQRMAMAEQKQLALGNISSAPPLLHQSLLRRDTFGTFRRRLSLKKQNPFLRG